MIARTAADDIDLVDGLDVFLSQGQVFEHDLVVFEVALHGVAHHARLLVDLFEHEIRVAAALGGIRIPIDMGYLRLKRLAACVLVLDAILAKNGQLTVV